jgi:hypothetical protein
MGNQKVTPEPSSYTDVSAERRSLRKHTDMTLDMANDMWLTQTS